MATVGACILSSVPSGQPKDVATLATYLASTFAGLATDRRLFVRVTTRTRKSWIGAGEWTWGVGAVAELVACERRWGESGVRIRNLIGGKGQM